MTSLHAMAQDLGSIWVDWEAPSLLPQGYLIEWGPDSHKYSNNSWRIEPNGNTTGILLEGKTGLGQRDGLRDRKKKQSECLSRGSKGQLEPPYRGSLPSLFFLL